MVSLWHGLDLTMDGDNHLPATTHRSRGKQIDKVKGHQRGWRRSSSTSHHRNRHHRRQWFYRTDKLNQTQPVSATLTEAADNPTMLQQHSPGSPTSCMPKLETEFVMTTGLGAVGGELITENNGLRSQVADLKKGWKRKGGCFEKKRRIEKEGGLLAGVN